VKRRIAGNLMAISLAAVFIMSLAGVLTYHNDNFRSGENLQETQAHAVER
jgi:hypothetical protein